MSVKKILFLLALCINVLFFSCQKEVDGRLDEEVDDIPEVEGTILWKYIIMDTTLPAGLDTLEKHLFDYDAGGRISRITLLTRSDTSSSPAYSDTLISNFFYQAVDTLPYRITTRLGDGTYSSDINSFFTFIDGKMVADSTDQNSITFIGLLHNRRTHYYTYSGTTVNARGRNIDDAGNLCETNYSISRTLNGTNILTETGTMTGCTIGGWDRQRAYDTHRNPLCFFNTPMPSSVLHDTYFWTAPVNNITLQESTSMFDHVTFSYTYNANSLPSVVRAYDITNTQLHKGLFYYRN